MNNGRVSPLLFARQKTELNSNFPSSTATVDGKLEITSQQSHIRLPREQFLSSEKYRVSDCHNSTLVIVTTQTSRFLAPRIQKNKESDIGMSSLISLHSFMFDICRSDTTSIFMSQSGMQGTDSQRGEYKGWVGGYCDNKVIVRVRERDRKKLLVRMVLGYTPKYRINTPALSFS